MDVNCKDDKGRTLLALCLLTLNEKSEEFITFLLEEKGADPNIADVEGVTPLILLAQTQIQMQGIS